MAHFFNAIAQGIQSSLSESKTLIVPCAVANLTYSSIFPKLT